MFKPDVFVIEDFLRFMGRGCSRAEVICLLAACNRNVGQKAFELGVRFESITVQEVRSRLKIGGIAPKKEQVQDHLRFLLDGVNLGEGNLDAWDALAVAWSWSRKNGLL